ncbi:BZ3500_MvSof-1268-A1-R1_Chr1-3g02095 [Microbotryum saponariae]|uniref:Tyrosine--tRNA ligase n=1 Tax=Microbotryum saponariae TaxID=289078 RepID=A0A2X0MGJ6_9BASI|nr:BZ3500_MvSof-1268-A1-R1_Chr1-3g02095 [Microbotryum saponariae]SCZ95397.1 BZ3501_MvSof-1269-A2-R1_Chr1-3g01697 [Microbotryum saponariae]
MSASTTEGTSTPTGSLSASQKYEIITQNLAEVLGGDAMKATLEERDLVAYWGTAPTGRPHLGYFVPLAKLADFITAGVEVKILLADVHAFLDNLKAPLELVQARAEYYRLLISSVFRSLHLSLDQVKFVVGSSYQYSAEYNLDKYKLTSITSEHDARKAGAEVVKQVSSPLLSGLLYPLLQALDEEYLGVDFQFGGVDQQRKIFTYAELYLPKLGYKKRSHLMNSMVPGLSGGKMSSSDPNSKIDFLDTPAQVKTKIQKAHCAPGEVEGNGVLAFIRNVVIPIGKLMSGQGRASERAWADSDDVVFTIKGDPKHGGQARSFASADDLEKAYAANEIHPGDLKIAVVQAINALLKPIQDDFNGSEAFKTAEAKAYPPEVKATKPKKEKKFTPKPEHLKTPEEKARDAAAAAAAAGGAEAETGKASGVESTGDLKKALDAVAN